MKSKKPCPVCGDKQKIRTLKHKKCKKGIEEIYSERCIHCGNLMYGYSKLLKKRGV